MKQVWLAAGLLAVITTASYVFAGNDPPGNVRAQQSTTLVVTDTGQMGQQVKDMGFLPSVEPVISLPGTTTAITSEAIAAVSADMPKAEIVNTRVLNTGPPAAIVAATISQYDGSVRTTPYRVSGVSQKICPIQGATSVGIRVIAFKATSSPPLIM